MAEICPFMTAPIGDECIMYCHDGKPTNHIAQSGCYPCKAWGVVGVEKVPASTPYVNPTDEPVYGCKLIER